MKTTNWPSQHGEEPHRGSRFFEARSIKLSIGFLQLHTGQTVAKQVMDLRRILYPYGRPLRLQVKDDDFPNEQWDYDVDVKKENLADYQYEDMSAVTIEFTEYLPVKHVFRANAIEVSITLNENNGNPIQISWGDYGYPLRNKFSGTFTKSYESADNQIVIVAGVLNNTVITSATGLTKLYEVLA